MAIISRKYNFVGGTTVDPLQVNAELNQLIEAHNDHDTRLTEYYTKVDLQTSGQAQIHWDNLIAKPNFADSSWKPSVATRADLPLADNGVGDQRVVLNDGDGKQAVYTCIATSGTIDQQWAKIGDVDWFSGEAIREAQESARVTAENNRVLAESGRVSAEYGRVSAESGRVSAENTRVNNENSRVTSESSRVSAEIGRVNAEIGRVNAEASRVTAENSRVTAENNRKHRGVYNPATTYSVGNEVSYQGSTYRCILASTGNTPTNDTYWVLVASAGDMVKAVYDPTNKNQDVFAYMDTHKNNTSNPHQTTAAQVGAPSMTTSELTYYVNVATGSDSNDGLTEGTAFKTIQKALNSVPQIINHRVIINIAAGTYNEAILTPKITGHATLRLVGASKATTFIQTITSYVDCNVLILEALNIRTITSKSGRIQLTDCTFDYANDYGIVADDGTVVELLSVGISNKTSIAILSRYGAVVILVQVSGSGNTKALSAQYGGKISRGWGNTITGTTQEERLYGGIIVDESGIPSGVLPLTGGTISGNLAITGALTRNSKTVYDTGNITISTSAPGSALAEGAIHMVY